MPSFIRALLWCIGIMLFREPRATALFLVAPPIGVDGVAPTAGPCLTVEQLLYWSDSICTGRAAQIDAKTKFRFGNIVPNQLTLLAFVQHTSASSMYKDNDNKISRQQKVLHMNKCLNVWHIFKQVSSFKFKRRNPTTVLMAKSQWKHTLCTPLSINCLFSVLSNINGEHKSTLMTSRNIHVAYQYKKTLNL